jgi:electron transfer flavoprotein alpha subunit
MPRSTTALKNGSPHTKRIDQLVPGDDVILEFNGRLRLLTIERRTKRHFIVNGRSYQHNGGWARALRNAVHGIGILLPATTANRNLAMQQAVEKRAEEARELRDAKKRVAKIARRRRNYARNVVRKIKAADEKTAITIFQTEAWNYDNAI